MTGSCDQIKIPYKCVEHVIKSEKYEEEEEESTTRNGCERVYF